jgi:hypothetical protein
MSMTDQRGWGLRSRIRFKEVVPTRRDRRGLRRQFRRAARATLAEQRAEMAALLQQLTADHVPLSEIMPGPGARDGIVVFLDGTQLLFVTRYGSADMKRLRERHRASHVPMRLVGAQPSFARCWFRLWFAYPCSTKLAEVLARVGPVPAGSFR